MRVRTALLATSLLATLPAAAAAQRLPALRLQSIGALPSTTALPADSSRGRRPLRLLKWVAVGGTVVAGAYGYEENRLADSRFGDLDKLCQAQPARCTPRTPSGAYTDPELEARYQEVRRLDRRATVGLVSAEIGVAASVALFLLDLRHAGHEPPNIPYRPPRLEIGPARDGGVRLGVHLQR